jgi:uncharacterized coiled-coil DUF342 family protein
MFLEAVSTLAAIDRALGLGDDGCADPDETLTAIEELKADRDAVIEQCAQVCDERNKLLTKHVALCDSATIREKAKNRALESHDLASAIRALKGKYVEQTDR